MPAANTLNAMENAPCVVGTTAVGSANQATSRGAMAIKTTPNNNVSTVCSTRSNALSRRVRSSTTKSAAVTTASSSRTAPINIAQAPCHSRHASARNRKAYAEGACRVQRELEARAAPLRETRGDFVIPQRVDGTQQRLHRQQRKHQGHEVSSVAQNRPV